MKSKNSILRGLGAAGCGHALAAIFGGQGAIVDGGIGVLDEPWDQADEHGSGLCAGEAFSEHLDCGGRCNFAKIHASHTIGDGEQIAV